MKQVKKPKRVKRSTLMNKADALVSKAVRASGKCFRCMSTTQLTAAHIIRRNYRAVRFDLDNLICLCWRCHNYFNYRELEWRDYIDKCFPGRWDRLKDKALTGIPPSYEEVIQSFNN